MGTNDQVMELLEGREWKARADVIIAVSQF
jgi:hypothetical protein